MIVLCFALWLWSSLFSPRSNSRDGCGCLIPAMLYLSWILLYGLLRQL